MGKVKKCLNAGCTEFILLDDGKTLIQPLDECDLKSVPKDYKKQLEVIARETTETIYVSKRAFKVKEGDEVPIA